MAKIKEVKKISGNEDDIQKLNQIINFCRDNYNITHSKTHNLALSGIEICERLNFSSEKNILEIYLAFFLWHNNEPQKALSIIYSISEKLLAKKNYLEFSLGVLITSLIEWSKGEVKLAFNTINEAFDELKNKENTKIAIIRLNWTLGVFYFDLDEIEESLFHYQLSKNSLDHESDFSLVAYINIGLASVYKKKQELEKAAILFEETLLYSQTKDIWMVEARAFYELGILEQINKNYKKAYSLFSKSYEIRVANNAKPAIVSSLVSMAQIDILTKNFADAEIKLAQGLEISEKKNLKPKVSAIMLHLSDIKEKQCKYKESLYFFKKHYALEEEIKNIVKNNKNAYLQLNYKVQKAARELKREKENLETRVIENTKQIISLSNNLVSQDKLAMIGEISAGIAHDLNTPLGAIKSGIGGMNLTLERLFLKIDNAPKHIALEAFNFANNKRLEMMGSIIQIIKDKQAFAAYFERNKFPQHKSNIGKIISLLVEIQIPLTDEKLINSIMKYESPEKYLDIVKSVLMMQTFSFSIEESITRSIEVISTLNTYVKEDNGLSKNKINLKENINNVLSVFRYRLTQNISLEFDVDDAIYIIGNEIKLFQLWSNIIKNALDCLEKTKNATIRIKTESEGNRINIIIANNGPEIPQNIQGKIFKKFFSTKQLLGGSGLGLSIVKSVVDDHNGTIKLTSNKNETQFIVSFDKEN